MYLVDKDDNRTRYLYVVTDYKIVDPKDVYVLNDFGDNRLTVISCTDDGTQRQVVVGKLNNNMLESEGTASDPSQDNHINHS